MKASMLIPMVSCLGMVSGFEAVSQTQAFRMTPQGHASSSGSSSSIFYRDEIAIEEDSRQTGSPPRKSRVDVLVHSGDQAEVDDYLVFLDRRYNRLHGDENHKPSSSGGWIQAELQRLASTNEGVRQHSYDDNSRLGAVGAAGKQLLQKLHVKPSSSALSGGPIVATTVTLMVSRGSPVLQVLSIVGTSVAAISRSTFLLQSHIRQKQRNQFNTLVAFLSKALNANAAKSARAVWQVGGGKKNVAWTLAVMAALVTLLLRPLAVAMGNHTALS